MKNFNLLSMLLIIILSSIIYSCKKEGDPSGHSEKIHQVKNENAVLNYIKELGYTESEITDLGNEYMVEGDILFPKKIKITSKKSLDSNPTTKQWGSANFIGYNN